MAGAPAPTRPPDRDRANDNAGVRFWACAPFVRRGRTSRRRARRPAAERSPMLKSVFVAGACLMLAPLVDAQVARVFVSVNGNDANSCSNIATPCRTLGGGISQVDPNGEVIVIDSGSYA